MHLLQPRSKSRGKRPTGGCSLLAITARRASIPNAVVSLAPPGAGAGGRGAPVAAGCGGDAGGRALILRSRCSGPGQPPLRLAHARELASAATAPLAAGAC